MITVVANLTGVSPISFSQCILEKKDKKESHEAFEARTWKQRLHVNEDGMIFIPPMALKGCLENASRRLSETIQGKGKATYTKVFEAGILCLQPLLLNIQAKDVESETLFVPADGRRGGTTRVWKTFPLIPTGWKTIAKIEVLDQLLIDEPERIHEYLVYGGQFVGLGRFRPERRGFYGRFMVDNFFVEK